VWIAPISLVVVFVFSFFPWRYLTDLERGIAEKFNLWGMAFSFGMADWVLYLLFTFFLGIPLLVAAFLAAKKLIPLPPAVQAWMWLRPAAVMAILLPGLIIIGSNWVGLNLTDKHMTAWMKLAFRVHLIAAVAAALEWWVDSRKAKNLPPPKVEVRW